MGSSKLTETFQKVKMELRALKHLVDDDRMWVAIDPSCVSQSSEPAFAFFQGREFIAQGTFGIKYKYGMSLALRLQLIRKVVQEEMSFKVAFVVLEHTPDVPIRTKKKAASECAVYMNPKSIASLKQACGVIKGSFEVGTPVVDMPPGVWHSVMRSVGKVTDKQDDTDARFIGEAALVLITQMEEHYNGESTKGKTKTKGKGKKDKGKDGAKDLS